MILKRRDEETTPLFLLRWTARIMSIAIMLLLAIFVLGEDGITAGTGPDGKEMIGLIFFPLGVVLGFIFGWRNELLGGIISVSSLACFYLVYGLMVSGDLPRGGWFAAFTIPGFMFLSYGLLRQPLFQQNGGKRANSM